MSYFVSTFQSFTWQLQQCLILNVYYNFIYKKKIIDIFNTIPIKIHSNIDNWKLIMLRLNLNLHTKLNL